MHWQQILRIIEERPQGEFPILDCERQFFTGRKINRHPQIITYDELIHRNFSIPEDGNLVSAIAGVSLQYFHDVHQTWGDDALAYYRPFHGQRNDWGIHILEEGVDYLATRIGDLADPGFNLSRLDVEYLAKQKLLLHELGHHAVEISHSLQEFDGVRDSYRRHQTLQQNEQMLHQNEEAVCNWNVKRNKHKLKIRALNHFNIISDFMHMQPDGYKNFESTTNQNFLERIGIRLQPGLPQRDNLEREFRQHSNLSRLKPRSARSIRYGFAVPIYLHTIRGRDLRRNN